MSKTFIEFLKPYEEILKKKIKKKGLTIAVSGSAGSGKSTGAKIFAKVFGLKYVSGGKIIRKLAEERGMPLQEFVATREKEIDHEIDRKNLELAMRGGCVIDGRLSGFAAGDWADVRVFYDCPLQTRASRLIRRDNLTIDEAKKVVAQRDEEDNKKYMQLYGVDMFDKSIYHLIIDNQKLSLEEAKVVPVKMIKEFLNKKGVLKD